jgi:hypothetical protein
MVPLQGLALGLALGFAVAITCHAQNNNGSCANGPQSRQCWGSFDINTDYYEVTPDTGNTVEVPKSFIPGSEPSIF